MSLHIGAQSNGHGPQAVEVVYEALVDSLPVGTRSLALPWDICSYDITGVVVPVAPRLHSS
jgi:hypothetical protein